MRILYCVFASAILAGCSVHPLPKDVSKEDTASIVRNIRCEAKFKVIDRVKELLEESPVPEIRALSPIQVLDDDKLRLIKDEHPTHPYKVDGQVIYPKDISAILTAFRSSVIGYDFEFEINETNNLGGGVGFKLPFTGGNANFGVNGGLAKSRLAKRTFKMEETFDDLRRLRCNHGEFYEDGHEYESTDRRFIYPLTGSIGMDDIMDSFLVLASLGNRESGSTFTDKLTFTTKVNGDIAGRTTLSSFPLEEFRLASAEAAYDASRQDVHSVTITLAFPVIEFRNRQQLLFDAEARRHAEEAALELVALEQCINSNKEDEIATGTLREFAPEQYCLSFAKRVTALRRGASDAYGARNTQKRRATDEEEDYER